MLNTLPDIETAASKKAIASIRQVQIVRKLTLIIPSAILLLVVIAAIFAPLLATYDPIKVTMTERFIPPAFVEGGNADHFLGTDKLGRDIFSRLIYGARISLGVSLLVIAITAGVGTVLGIVSGSSGGRMDNFLMRVTDISLSFPPILVRGGFFHYDNRLSQILCGSLIYFPNEVKAKMI